MSHLMGALAPVDDGPAVTHGVINTVCKAASTNRRSRGTINRETDKLIADGTIDPKSGTILGSGSISRQGAIGALYQNGSAYRIIGQLCFAKQAVLTHLLDTARVDVLSGNLIGTLINFRSVIEHIAHFDAVLRKVQSYPSSPDFNDANKALQAMNGTLVEMTYGSRADWKGLLTGDAEELMIKKKTKYQPEPNRIDREADSIMDAVDGITKKIKGVRAVYEVLCEFAHPNVGTILGLTKSAQPYVDDQGVHWVAKELTLGAPIAAAKEMGDVLNFVFQTVARCVVRFEELLKAADQERTKAQQLAQTIIRQALRANPDLLAPYASCPCDSGEKVKFCCGKSPR